MRNVLALVFLLSSTFAQAQSNGVALQAPRELYEGILALACLDNDPNRDLDETLIITETNGEFQIVNGPNIDLVTETKDGFVLKSSADEDFLGFIRNKEGQWSIELLSAEGSLQGTCVDETQLVRNIVTAITPKIFENANVLIAKQAQHNDDLAALDADKANLRQSLLAAQATIAAKTEQAALAKRQRELIDEMLVDLRREAKNTNINLANTLALLATVQDHATELEQENLDLKRSAEELAAALSDEELKRVSAAFLRERLEVAEVALNQKELEQLAIAAAAETLRADLEESEAAISSLTLQLNDQRKKAEETLALMAAAQSVEKAMDAELSKARTELRYADAISTEAQRKMALLSQEVRELRAQIGGLQATLDDYKRRDADNNVKITNLGSELNVALAQVAAEAKRNLVLEAALSQNKLEKVAMEAAIYKLRSDLEQSEMAISSLTLELNDQRKKAE
ncbi:hypothetical protein N9O86_02870 [Planktomarina temperata]|nr:hypothetical protein [Planktomarina temperata]